MATGIGCLPKRFVRNRLDTGESDMTALERTSQQVLAMHKIEIRGFKNGKWSVAKAPEWFGRATDTDDAWTKAFARYNVILVDEFDCGDSVEIYRAENGTY